MPWCVHTGQMRMYTYVSALMKARGKNTRWLPVNISTVQMRDIFKKYYDGYITLTNPALSNGAPRYMRLQDLKKASIRVIPNLSFTNFLANIGNRTLPTTSDLPVVENTQALYADAIKARYDIQRVHPSAPPENPYPLGAKTDLLLNKTGVISSNLYNNCMFTVNGLFHMADLSIYGTKIKDGGRTCEVSNMNNVGILSFREIGQIEYLPVNSGMMVTPDVLIQEKQSVWLDTNTDMTNKTPILVIGGYMHIQDSVFSVINVERGLIHINFQKIQFLHRYFESKEIIDLSSLGLTVASYNDQLVALEELYSEEVISAYIDLSQTFVVLVDAPMLYTDVHPVHKTFAPGVYQTGAMPKHILQTQYGHCPEYWARKEYDQWILSTAHGTTPNFLFDTTNWQSFTAVDNAEEASNPRALHKGRMIEIGCERITF